MPEPLVLYDRWVPDELTHHLLVANVDTGFTREVTARSTGEALWSPDGTVLAVDRVKEKQSSECSECTDVVLMRTDGTEVRTLSQGGNASVLSWSPDGTRLAYFTNTDPAHEDGSMHVVDVDGTDDRAITLPDGEEGSLAWSPDGSRILVWTLFDGTWVLDADGTHPRHITSADINGDRTAPEKRIRQDDEPVWAADSRHVLLPRDTGTIERPDVDLYLIDTDHPHDIRPLELSRYHPYAPLLSPDGRLLAFEGNLTGVDCTFAVYVVPAGGGAPRRLTKGQSTAIFGMSWSSDSRQVAYSGPLEGAACGDDQDEQAVRTVDVLTGAVRLVPSPYPAWLGGAVRLRPLPVASSPRG